VAPCVPLAGRLTTTLVPISSLVAFRLTVEAHAQEATMTYTVPNSAVATAFPGAVMSLARVPVD